MKILFLIPSLSEGGAERVLVNLVNNLDRKRFDITVQTVFDEGRYRKDLGEHIRYRSFMKHQFRGNSRILALIPAEILYRLIVGEEYDVAVSWLEGVTAHILSGCPYRGTKRVAWIHATVKNGKHLSAGFISPKAAAKAYAGMDAIACVSEDGKLSFLNTMHDAITHADFPRCVVLRNVNDSSKIRRLSENKPDEPETGAVTAPEAGYFADCREHVPQIVSVGRLTDVKGYDLLAEVHARLMREGLRHRITVIGKGEGRKVIEAYLRKNGFTDTFRLPGYMKNPYPYVAKADLYVCASRSEGMSTAVTEALILGTPVLSTDVSGARELLGDSEYGLIVENSAEGLYQGMKKLLTEPALLKQYRKKAAERGREFSMEQAVRETERFLSALSAEC